MFTNPREREYKPLPKSPENDEENNILSPHESSRTFTWNPLSTLVLVLSLAASFITGALVTLYLTSTPNHPISNPDGIAPYFPLTQIAGKFIHNSPFSKEPPQGPGAGNVSEEVWDALIPNGLGYFDPSPDPTNSSRRTSASNVVIPTIFHQLHCLYLLRRAYHTTSPEDDLQRFDFGRNRTVHVAHCFDYLAQSLLCSADSTLEPAVDHEHGFLGSGFERKCWDFEALKETAEERRVFDAVGFLAWGVDVDGEGRVHLD